MNNPEITGTINSARALEVMIGAGAKGKTAFYHGLRQALENAVDANCTVFNISLDKKNDRILFSDDGAGFKRENLQSFFSLYESSKLLDTDTIGKNGSGRIFLLQIAETLDVYTKSTDFTQMMNFTLDRTYLEALISNGSRTSTILPIRTPSWWSNRETGTSIELKNINWKRVPSEKKIIEEFSEMLSPSIAKLVRINNKKLRPRAIFGEVIEKQFHNEDLGQVSIELFFPESGSRDNRIKLGARNPIISLYEVSQLLVNSIATELTGSTISGNIFIEKIGLYRGHDSRSLDDSFYESDISLKVCDFLNNYVSPLVNDVMARKKTEEDKQRESATLKNLSSTFNDAFGDPEKTEIDGDEPGEKNSESQDANKTQNSLKLSISRISICPNDTISVEVIGAKKSDTFTWELSGKFGILSKKSGAIVDFTARKVGKSVITVTNSHTNKVGTCSVNVVNADEVSLSPSYIEVEAGKSQTFRIVTKRKDIKAKWIVSSERLQCKIISKDAISISCEEVGTYTIQLFDTTTSEMLAEATMKVAAPKNEMNNIINIEGHNYLIEASSLPIPAVVELAPARLNPIAGCGATIDVLLIDLQHEIITVNRQLTSSVDAGYNALFPYLIAAHLMSKSKKDDEEISNSFMMVEIARISTVIMRARKKSSRKS